METVERKVFQLEDKIVTNYSGYNQLSKFYHFCLKQPAETSIHLDFANIEWFDGNLCALLWAIVYKLKGTHRHTFTADEKVIKKRFDVLFRNGFFQSSEPVYDDRQSTIPIQAFNCNDKEAFCNYVDHELLAHRGIPKSLNAELKEKISEDLLEVFCNTHYHANTTDPFFVGGQYYPFQGYLKFTMVDLGDGFLPRVKKATAGEITTNVDAILWALKGNSTKKILEHCPGGLGIKSMYSYCLQNKGVLQIISNNGFWSSDLQNTIFEGGRELTTPFLGTTINLLFQNT